MSGGTLILMAVVMGLMYWIARGMIGGYFAFFFIASPIVVGVVAGLIYGDLKQGLIIGGGIAAAFAGIIAPGGNLPTDSALAATTVIPIALATGLSAEQAIAFAVPMGLVGSFVTNLRKIVNVIFVHRADKCAENGDSAGLTRCAIIYPPLIELPLLFLPVFLVVMFGQDAMLASIYELCTNMGNAWLGSCWWCNAGYWFRFNHEYDWKTEDDTLYNRWIYFGKMYGLKQYYSWFNGWMCCIPSCDGKTR